MFGEQPVHFANQVLQVPILRGHPFPRLRLIRRRRHQHRKRRAQRLPKIARSSQRRRRRQTTARVWYPFTANTPGIRTRRVAAHSHRHSPPTRRGDLDHRRPFPRRLGHRLGKVAASTRRGRGADRSIDRSLERAQGVLLLQPNSVLIVIIVFRLRLLPVGVTAATPTTLDLAFTCLHSRRFREVVAQVQFRAKQAPALRLRRSDRNAEVRSCARRGTRNAA
eukprot:91560-Prorocentrum_minimum.AAC.3